MLFSCFCLLLRRTSGGRRRPSHEYPCQARRNRDTDAAGNDSSPDGGVGRSRAPPNPPVGGGIVLRRVPYDVESVVHALRGLNLLLGLANCYQL